MIEILVYPFPNSYCASRCPPSATFINKCKSDFDFDDCFHWSNVC
jgi:hypothetical protein